MKLTKYKDNYDKDYSYFWTHMFRDGKDKVVSPVFSTKEDALHWGEDLKKRIEEYSANA